MKVNKIIFLLVVGLMILPTFGGTITLDSKGIEYTVEVNQSGDVINYKLTIDTTGIKMNKGLGVVDIHAIGFKTTANFGGEDDSSILDRVTIVQNPFGDPPLSILEVGTATSLTTDPTDDQVLDTAGWITLIFDQNGLATGGASDVYTWEFNIDVAGLNPSDPSFKVVFTDYTSDEFAFLYSSGSLTVPEPSTLILLLSGTGLLAGAARFRKKT